jgi:hypothetical protein
MEGSARKLTAAIAVLVVFVVGYFVLRSYNDQQAEIEAIQAEANTTYVTEAVSSDITAFSYLVEGETLSFTKDGDNWVYDADPSIDIDESAITTLLGGLDNLKAEQVVTAESGVDYGFETPTNTISYTTSSGTSTLTIGMENPVTSQYYVKTDASEQIYIIATDLATTFTQTVADLTKVEETATPSPSAS